MRTNTVDALGGFKNQPVLSEGDLISFHHHNQLSFCLAQVQGSCDRIQS